MHQLPRSPPWPQAHPGVFFGNQKGSRMVTGDHSVFFFVELHASGEKVPGHQERPLIP